MGGQRIKRRQFGFVRGLKKGRGERIWRLCVRLWGVVVISEGVVVVHLASVSDVTTLRHAKPNPHPNPT